MSKEWPPTPSTLAQPPLEVLDEIREKLWTFTAFLFAVDGGRPAYSGAATCVAASGISYLLTAAHVWKALQGSSFAVSLDAERLPIAIQRDFVETKTLSGSGAPEWGPDLALIRLPDLIAADIRQVKAFYDLGRSRPGPVSVPGSEQLVLWAIVGAAAEQSTFGPKDEVFKLSLFDAWTVQADERDGFDYHELAFDHERRPALPQSYRGISGSGLWQVPVTVCAESSEICWTESVRLAGVAFYERSLPPHQSFIRCHGPKSLKERLLKGVV